MNRENETHHGARYRRAASVLRFAALVLAGAALILACVGYWLKSTILDSDEFTSKVDDVLAEPATQQRIGAVVAQRVVDSGVVQQRIDETLPPDASFVATLLEGQLQDILSRLIGRAASLDATRDLVSAAVLRLHQQVVLTLENRRDRLKLQGDDIVLDLNDTVTKLFERLGIGAPADQDAGTVVLVQDARSLERASLLVRTLNTLVPVLFVSALALLGLVVLTSRDRGRALAHVGYAILIAGVVSLLAWRAVGWGTSAFLHEAPVGRALIDSLASNLKTDALFLVAAGAVIAVSADAKIRGWAGRQARQGAAAAEALGATRIILLGAALATLLLLIA